MQVDLNHPLIYLTTAAFVALVGLYAWRQPRRPGSRHFLWMTAVWVVWALAAAFSLPALGQAWQYRLWALQVACLLLSYSFEMMFCLEYTGNEKWLHRRILAYLTFPALIFACLVILLPPDSLATAQVGTTGVVVNGAGWIKWLFLSYSVAIWLISAGVFYACLLRAPAFSDPILLLILGQTLPLLAYFTVCTWLREVVVPIQSMVLSFNVTALAYGFALYNFRFLRTIPVARDRVISHMPYGMIVLDPDNFIVDFNPTAQSLPGLPGLLAFRQPALSALGEWWQRVAPLIGPEAISKDFVIPTPAGQQYFQVFSMPLAQASGWRLGQALVFHNITRSRQVEQEHAQNLWAQATLQERKQLANELHDGLSQNLAFMNLQAQTAQVYLSSGQVESARDSLVRLVEAAGQIQDDTREMIGNLLTISRPVENFYTALGQMLTRFEQQTGLEICLEINGVDTPAIKPELFLGLDQLPSSASVQLIRITQEALANVRKHARGATRVIVQLKISDEQVFLTISDNGAGFLPASQVKDGSHFGLLVMRQRANTIGGQVDIWSAPGEGSRVEVSAPLAVGETREMA